MIVGLAGLFSEIEALATSAMVGLAGGAAQARVFIGVGIPFPGFYPAPYYYPPVALDFRFGGGYRHWR